MKLADYSARYTRAEGQKNLLDTQLRMAKEARQELKESQKTLEQAQALIQVKAQETQNQLSYHVEDIVQLCIDTCFPKEEFEFKLAFEIKRGKTEAELQLKKDGYIVDPALCNGGGVMDMEAFGLRISAWSIEKTDNVIILDEPFRFLSADLRPLAGEILRELSQKLQLQFIIVTHDESIIESSDMVARVVKRGKESRIKIQ